MTIKHRILSQEEEARAEIRNCLICLRVILKKIPQKNQVMSEHLNKFDPFLQRIRKANKILDNFVIKRYCGVIEGLVEILQKQGKIMVEDLKVLHDPLQKIENENDKLRGKTDD